ncbi:GroEL apical domain-like protein [Tuber magnatum]|uniref:GroEL apical domain-like protein n=1 Tax=Tuber magnatum TaxID=42249 RepID=A0A317SND5_9PEZI|nr:GroEL apical domain-like protein [Tuber magnatum]
MNTQSEKSQTGRKAQISSITAAKTEMLKMLLDPMGGIREIEVAHTAARSLIEWYYYCYCPAGEILAQNLEHLQCNIHPAVVIQAFQKALADVLAIAMHNLIQSYIGTKFTFRWWKLMFDLALLAVHTAVRDQRGRKEVNIKNHTRIEKILGGEIEDSRVLVGIMLNKDITHLTMRRRIENLRIFLLNCGLEYRGAGPQTNIEISMEEDWMFRPDLVNTEKRVSDLAQHYLLKGNVTALRRARKTNNNHVTCAVGATSVDRVDDINESDVSTKYGLCEIEKINSKACTILRRSPSKDILNQIECNIQVAIAVARKMAISVHLMISKSIEGVQQRPYRGVAEALEVVPRTLATNSGASPISILTQLCAKCVAKEHTWRLTATPVRLLT